MTLVLSDDQLGAVHLLLDRIRARQLQDFGRIGSDVKPDDAISFEPLGEESTHSSEDLDSLVLIDETETSDQLDLAQACIQIGDEEGARRILQTLVDGEDKESAEKAFQILKTL